MKAILIVVVLFIASSAEATTYWVSPSGGAPNCGAASGTSEPKVYLSTVALGIGCLAVGDTLNIKAGSYNEIISTGQFTGLVGSSFPGTTIQGVTGPSLPITESSVWPVQILGGFNFCAAGAGTTMRYVTFKNIGVRTGMGISDCGGSGNVDHLYFDTMEFHHTSTPTDSLIYLGNGGIGDNMTVINSSVHDNGFSAAHAYHGFYVDGSNETVANTLIYNISGYGIQNYCDIANNNLCCDNINAGVCIGKSWPLPSNNSYYNNIIHDTGRGLGSGTESAGAMVISRGQNTSVYNNVMYNNQNGIALGGFPSMGSKVYSNTITTSSTQYQGAGCCFAAIGADNTVNANIRNNILYGNGAGNAYDSISTGGATGLTMSNNRTTDPTWVSPANHDYRLCTGAGTPTSSCIAASTALNTGAALGSPYNVDIVGTSRPQPVGGSYDPGAYEMPAGPPAPTCPTTNMLVAQYSFDGVATDSSGNGNTATLGTGVTYATGKYNQGLLFPTNGSVTVPHSSSLVMCDFTVSAWVLVPSTLTAFAALAAVPYGDGTNAGWFLYAGSTPGSPGGPSGGFCASDCGVATGEADYGTAISANTLTYLTVTYDHSAAGSNVKLWVNGINVSSSGTITTVLADWTGNLTIGSSIYGEYLPNNSIVDELRIYNYARTQVQIQQDRDTSINPTVPSGTPVVMKLSALTQKIAGGTTEKIGNAP
jgi:hypothetical protein